MSASSAPSIRQREGNTFVRFPPQRQWGFVSVERFELKVQGQVPMSQLRHTYAQLDDVKISSSFKDFERLLTHKLSESDFTEIHLESPDLKDEVGAAPLICWGVYHPQEQRPQPFYLEGGFHALPHGVRFEFYAGVIFGLGDISASTLAARLLKDANMPTQHTHPTVINFDPLTELSISCCLDWGWKLPRRRLASCLEVTDSELRFLAGQNLDDKIRRGEETWRSGVTPQQSAHLEWLKRHHEGEGFVHTHELESALIFYQSHLDNPHGSLRYFELRRWLEGPSESLRSWVFKSSMTTADQHKSNALVYEAEGQHQRAADAWADFADADDQQETERVRSPHAKRLISGLTHYTRGLLLKETNLKAATQELEKARELLTSSPNVLHACAQVATQLNDRFLAQARLTEMAQYLMSSERSNEAAKVWVQLGELWSNSSESWDSAERAYLRAIETAPELQAPYYQLSDLYVQRGELANAKVFLERLLEHSPYAEKAAQRLKSIESRSTELLDDFTSDSTDSNLLEDDDQLITGVITVMPKPSVEDVAPLDGGQLLTPDLIKPKLEGPLKPPPSPLSAAPSALRLWSIPPLEQEAENRLATSHVMPSRLPTHSSTLTSVRNAAVQDAAILTSESAPIPRAASPSRSDVIPKVPMPPRGKTPSRWSSDQLDALHQVIASAHDQPAPSEGQRYDSKLVRNSGEYKGQARQLKLQEQLNTLKDLVTSKKSKPQSRTQACLEIAVIYRDKMLDLEQAKDWLWRGLRLDPQGVTLHDLRESLVEIYTSKEDYRGLLEYHQFVADQEWGDHADAHMQRASLLKLEGRLDEALTACDESLRAFDTFSSRRKRSRQQERERVIKLKADLLSTLGDPLAAGAMLLDNIDSLGDMIQWTRMRLAARVLAEVTPQHAAHLYKDLYQSDPSESRLEEWLAHVNYWGDPHARAEAIRAYAAVMRSDSTRVRLAPRCLSQLAHDIKDDAPLLALDLYFESLCDHPDPDIAERAVDLAQRHHQNQALLRALGSLIPECLPGEYRGLLKLKRSFALATIHDKRSQDALTDALKELQGGVEDQMAFSSTLEWAQQVCTPETFSDYVEQLEAAGLGH
jgi:tetratricopeptide (TPR) repeat protein